MTVTVPRWSRVATVMAVLVVAAVAAIVSYAHMRALGIRAGEGWRADILPLSVDGLLVAASLVLYVRRRAGLRAKALPWAGLMLGVSASVAANISAAEPTILGRLVAGWPPLAFALAFELFVLLVRDTAAPPDVESYQIIADSLDDQEAEDRTHDWWGSAPFAATEAGRTAQLIDAGVGRRRLAAELGVSEHKARQLLAERNGVSR
jgi:hypothetical protein